MTDKLGIYNGALRILKERRLASLGEAREPRRLLDDAWGDGATEGVVKYCLQMGQWTFATRTAEIEHSPSVEPPFGYRHAFDQPTDMVRVTGLYTDPQCTNPLMHYIDERHYWYADLATLYVSYVSNHADYGADLSLWPESFVRLVEAGLAREIAGNLTQGETRIQAAEMAWRAAKAEAHSLDAMNKPARFLPAGSWSRARGGSWRDAARNGQ